MCIRDRAKVMPIEEAVQYMKDAATKSYSKKGQDVVEMNHKAIDAGVSAFVKIDVPADWATAEDKKDDVKLAGPEKPVSYTHLDVYKRQGYAGGS